MAQEVQDKAIAAANAAGMDPALVLGLVEQESGFNPTAKSPAGARGPMQIMPATERELRKKYGDDHYDQGVGYLKELDAQFGEVENPDERQKFALAAYNAGPERVRKAMAKAEKKGTSPLLFANISRYLPSETQNYVPQVRMRADRQANRAEATPRPTFDALAKLPGWEQLSPDDKRAIALEVIPEAGQLQAPALDDLLGIPGATLRAPTTAERITGTLAGADRPISPGGAPVGAGSFGAGVVETLTNPEMAAEQAGSLVGELAGSPLGIPGIVGGGALGAAGGRALVRAATGKPIGQETALAGLIGAAGPAVTELGGRLVGRGVGAFGGGQPTKAVTREGLEATDFLAGRYAKEGFVHAPLTAAEKTESGLQDIAQNLAEGGFTGVGAMNAYTKNRTEANRKVAESLLNDVSTMSNPTKIAGLVDAALTSKSAAQKLHSTTLAQQFLARAGDTEVPIDSLIRLARPAVERGARTGGVVDNPLARALHRAGLDIEDLGARKAKTQAEKFLAVSKTELSSARRALTHAVTEEDVQAAQAAVSRAESAVEFFSKAATGKVPTQRVLTIRDLYEIRKRLNLEIRGRVAGERVPTDIKAFAKRARNEVDRLITENADPQSAALFRESNRLVKERKQDVDSKFLRDLVRRTDPEAAGVDFGSVGGSDSLVSSIFRNENTIARAQKALGVESAEWKALERRWLQQRMAGAMDQNGVINGRGLLASLTGKAGENEAMFAAAVPDAATRRNWIRFANSLAAQQEQRSGVGRMAIQLTQGGIALTALGSVLAGAPAGGAIAGASTVLLAPYMLSKLITSKRGVKLLTEAFETPATARRATSLALKVAAEAKAIQREERNRRFVEQMRGIGPSGPSSGAFVDIQ